MTQEKEFLVSILLPVYNVEPYLRQCLDSIIGQTYRKLQIVLVDDGSSDNSWQICQEYASKDKRVEAYHQENQGVAAARNALLEHVRGDYVIWVDSDDWIEPNMIDFLVGQAIHSGADVVTCSNVINDSPISKQYTTTIYDRENAVHQFLRHIDLRGQLWNKLVRANLVINERFRVEISYGEDALFCWGIIQKLNTMLFTDRQLYHYRMNQQSLSHGSFGPKKMSAYYVWKSILHDTELFWPQYMDDVRARYCIECILLLRCAAQSGYKRDDSIKKLQEVIRRYNSLIKKIKMSSWKMTLYGKIGFRAYSCLRFLTRFDR